MINSFAVLSTEDHPRIETTLFIKEGFSIWALIFGGFWLLYKRLWWQAIIVLLIQLFVIGGLVGEGYEWAVIVDLGFKVWIGFSATDWLINDKLRKGYKLQNIMVCGDKLEAQLRFFSDYLVEGDQLNGHDEDRDDAEIEIADSKKQDPDTPSSMQVSPT